MDTEKVENTLYNAIYEPDLPPEYCHYKDEGCDLATARLGHQSSCLECPFERCIYEQPRGRQRYLKTRRDSEIAKIFNKEGKKIKEIARIFGLSERTIQRAIKGEKR